VKHEEIILKIDGYTPGKLPMSRLAEYLGQFAALLGNEANVHFSKLTKGSANCKAYADEQAVPKVRERVESVVSGTAPKPALKAHKDIDDLLAQDNTTGGLYLGQQRVIEFPGRMRGHQEKIGPVNRSTSITGQIFMIGGRDETINVHLRDKSKSYKCEVSIELARKLAPYFLTGTVRLFGHGDWYRIDGRWEMWSFTATDFVLLESKTLGETIDGMRQIFSGIDGDEFLAGMEQLRRE